MKGQIPVFVEQPDGRLSQGVPSGYEEHTPPGTPPHGLALDPTILSSPDVVRVLAKHEMFFLSLLLIQLIVQVGFETLHVSNRGDAIAELLLVYPGTGVNLVSFMFWFAFVIETLYCILFFSAGVAAAFRSRPWLYEIFATVALIGTLGQLPLVYVNQFNLLIFFLRFISYAYARFMWNLLVSIALIREDLI